MLQWYRQDVLRLSVLSAVLLTGELDWLQLLLRALWRWRQSVVSGILTAGKMPKVHKVIQSFNAGELSPYLDARIDQQKYAAGCRIMENFIPLIYGGAQERPGLEYIATQKSSLTKGRVVAFEHSVDDAYILLFENQVVRVFRNGAQILTGTGIEDLSSIGSIVGHWTLNDNASSTTVVDTELTYDGTMITNNTEDLHADGKVGSGSLDLAGTDAAYVADAAGLSFDDSGTNKFSIIAWINVTVANTVQTILSKWKSGSLREWKFSLNADRKLQLHLADDSKDLSTARVAHWKCNDNAGSTAVDDDVNSIPHDGVASANTTSLHATGKTGTGCFDMNSQYYVTVTTHAELTFDDTSDEDMSIASWIYVNPSSTTQVILSKWETAKLEWRIFITTAEKLAFQTRDDSAGKNATITSDDALSEGWHFVVATYKNSHASWSAATAATYMTLYVDGAVVGSTAVTDTGYLGMEAKAGNVLIGANTPASPTNFFTDKIDNLALFNKALSAAEVLILHNGGDGTEDLEGTFPSNLTDDALAVGWHSVAVTYDSGGGATAADGIKFYVDGALVDSTASNETTYAAMEGTNIKVLIGARYDSSDAIKDVWMDKIDNVALFSKELSAANVATLFTSSVYEISTPYLTADLPVLKFEHSADVMYITHPNYEERKLSRTSHDGWTLEVLGLENGPFRDQNTDTSATIVANGTTGSVTLTAVGHTPFVAGTTAGHSPGGALVTSKSQTGALFKLIHAITTDSIDDKLTNNYTSDQTLHTSITSELTVYKGITWDFTTQGTWTGTVKLEREYGNNGIWETVTTVVSIDNKNVTTSGTEEFEDAQYRVKMHASGDASESCEVQFSVRDSSHIGIVKITAVASPASATATVLTTLGSTDKTHRWAEGSFSNYRGWPIDVTISSEERLTFAGNISEPLTTWGGVIGDYSSFKEGVLDDDALTLTLVGSGQQNRIRWILSKNTLVLGTVGGEHILGASKEEEALTPTNVKAKLQTTYGSENIAALVVNQAILFVQRGGRKIREFLYRFTPEAEGYVADDLTVFSNHITESGIVDMAFQRTPDPMLWCVRSDGEMAIMTYERDQSVFSWARFITSTADSDSNFESTAVIYGGAGKEDEVWVTVKRVLASGTVRYVERFYQRAMPSSMSDMKYLDSFITYVGATVTATGLSHLIGEEVQVLTDGKEVTEATAGDFTVTTGGEITLPAAGTTVQIGLGYTATVKPMKLDLNGMGLTITKKINRGVFSVFETIGGEVGGSTSTLQDIPTGTDALFTGSKEIPLKDGYSRAGDIMARQTKPLPMTILSFSLDVGANAD